MEKCIYYRFGRGSNPEALHNLLVVLAGDLQMEQIERSWNNVHFRVKKGGTGVLSFHWHKAKTIRANEKDEVSKDFLPLQSFGALDDEYWFCAGKTEAADAEEHIKAAEFLRVVATFCQKTDIYDTVDYYERKDEGRALEAFKMHTSIKKRVLGLIKQGGASEYL